MSRAPAGSPKSLRCCRCLVVTVTPLRLGALRRLNMSVEGNIYVVIMPPGMKFSAGWQIEPTGFSPLIQFIINDCKNEFTGEYIIKIMSE